MIHIEGQLFDRKAGDRQDHDRDRRDRDDVTDLFFACTAPVSSMVFVS